MAEVGNGYFIDGGVVANAPDLCAVQKRSASLTRSPETSA
jgi:patatin-like phospholipase/acyl hydrolase